MMVLVTMAMRPTMTGMVLVTRMRMLRMMVMVVVVVVMMVTTAMTMTMLLIMMMTTMRFHVRSMPPSPQQRATSPAQPKICPCPTPLLPSGNLDPRSLDGDDDE